MKRFILPILCLAVLAGCSSQGDRVQEQLDEFAPIQIGSSFVEGISENGREVLNYFRLASTEVDNIYWDQSFGDKTQLDAAFFFNSAHSNLRHLYHLSIL